MAGDLDEQQELIRGVVARPDDDAPRLAYADWLDRHGQPSRARLIRVQCQLEDLRGEERLLLGRHGHEWAKPLLACGVDRWEFHRGFPEELSLSGTHYLNNHERINDLTPATRLHLGVTDGLLSRLSDLPAAGQIRSLELGHPDDAKAGRVGVTGLQSLAASPHLTGLTELVVHSHAVGLDGARAIAGSPNFRHLRRLALPDPALSRLDVGCWGPLLRSPTLGNLVELQWGVNRHGPNALRIIRESMTAGPSPATGPGRS